MSLTWWQWILFFIFWSTFLYGAIYDAKYHIILNRVPMILGISGGLILLHPIESIMSSIILGGFLLFIALINSNFVGGGDIKLMFALGIALGWSAFYVYILSSLLALIYGIIKNGLKGNKPIPFAPFALMGTLGVFIIVL